MLEEDIIAWARELGFAPSDSSLSKASVAKLCNTTANRKVWEFLLSHYKPKQEVLAVRQRVATVKVGGLSNAQEVAEVKRKAQQRAEIAHVASQNQSLQEVWERQSVRLEIPCFHK